MSKLFPAHPLVILLLISILAGCSSSQSFYLDSDYQEARVEAPVLIMPLEQSQFEDFYSHTFGSLSTDQKRSFHTDVESLYRKYTGADTRVNREESLDSGSFEARSLEVADEVIEVIVPKPDAELTFSNMESGFILLLDQYRYLRTRDVKEKSTYAGHEVEVNYALTFETSYVYWDTASRQAVAWGIARGRIGLDGESVAPEDYTEVLQQAIRNIAQNGPVHTRP